MILIRPLLREECTFHSDGHWNDGELVAARDLYKVLWPGELVFCPWTEEVDGVQTAGCEVEALNAAPTVIGPQVSVEEKLSQLQRTRSAMRTVKSQLPIRITFPVLPSGSVLMRGCRSWIAASLRRSGRGLGAYLHP